MFQLDDKDLNIARKLLKMELEGANAKVYVFGSRAKGSARRFSDLDLAIDFGGKKMPRDIRNELESFFEASNISVKADIVDLNDVKESFRNIIAPDLREFPISRNPQADCERLRL